MLQPVVVMLPGGWTAPRGEKRDWDRDRGVGFPARASPRPDGGDSEALASGMWELLVVEQVSCSKS